MAATALLRSRAVSRAAPPAIISNNPLVAFLAAARRGGKLARRRDIIARPIRARAGYYERDCHHHRSSSLPCCSVVVAPIFRRLSGHPSDEGNSTTSSSPSSSADLHSLYHEQMREIESEKFAVFGTSDDDDDGRDLSRTAETYFSSNIESKGGVGDDPSQQNPTLSPEDPPSSSPPSALASSLSSSSSSPPLPPNWDAEEAHAERDALFNFSEEERGAWRNNNNNNGGGRMDTSQLRRLREMMREARNGGEDDDDDNDATEVEVNYTTPSTFSHLTPKGDGVSMVDVGDKSASRRVAVARSVVTFPPEVMSAFRVNGSYDEMVGPKGPIFETAKLAGIMGAKKTSDLIPLCHPLPLDRVNIDIRLVNNMAIIECECRVTHKTGVEMEALTGASVAALTIYDMVKAVSHRVEIGRTVLVSKSGGKSGKFVRDMNE